MRFFAPFPDRWSALISVVGGLLLLYFLGEVAAIVLLDLSVPDGYLVGILTSVPVALALGYGGYWLARSDLEPTRHRRVFGWLLAFLIGFVILNVGIMAAMRTRGLLLATSWLRWAAALGGAIGLLIGVFEARSIERQLATERGRIRQQALKRQNDRLEEFASVVSHDLRNPMNVALGNLSLAQREHDSEHLDAIETALERMNDIVDDTLTLAREGRIVGERSAVDLEELVTECRQSVETDDATVAVEASGTIQADADRMRHVFENLFWNAIEHGADGESVTIRVGNLDSGDGFYVADDGPGIPPDRRESVFEMGETSSESGTGFGLAIVKQIVDAHGWNVRVTESRDGGARFEITGPSAAETAAAVAPRAN